MRKIKFTMLDYFIIFNQKFSKNTLNRNITKHTISQIKHEILTQCPSPPRFSTKLNVTDLVVH